MEEVSKSSLPPVLRWTGRAGQQAYWSWGTVPGLASRTVPPAAKTLAIARQHCERTEICLFLPQIQWWGILDMARNQNQE